MKIRAFNATPLLGGKEISCHHHFSPPSPQVQNLGRAAKLLEIQKTYSNWFQKKVVVICHPQNWEIMKLQATLHHTCFAPREKLLISVFWIYWRQKKDSHQIPSTAQKKKKKFKIAEFMTSSCSTTSHFIYTTLLYISPPSTTEIFPAPDFWTLIAGDFPSWAAYNFFE